jgi:LDH2 family malate/lactate/ureidoglycolate dehydrogenase
MTSATALVPADRLHQLAVALLVAAGVPPRDATTVADSLVDADLRGVHTHGVTRLGIYIERLRRGGNRAVGEVTIVADAPAFALLDGHDLLSQVVSARAVELAVEKAAVAGCAAVSVRGGSHFGAAGYWARLIAERGMAGMATTNSSALMVAWGGSTTAIGTNPLALAFPSAGGAPVVVDIATSETSWGALLQAEAAGVPIPETWALGRDGAPTREAAEALKAQRLLPLARHKGYALAVAVELLGGALAGARLLADVPDMYEQPQEPMALGHLFLALDPRRLGAEGPSLAQAVHGVQLVLNALPPRQSADRVLWPGQLEAERAEQRRRDGVPLPAAIVDAVVALAEELGVEAVLPSIPNS